MAIGLSSCGQTRAERESVAPVRSQPQHRDGCAARSNTRWSRRFRRVGSAVRRTHLLATSSRCGRTTAHPERRRDHGGDVSADAIEGSPVEYQTGCGVRAGAKSTRRARTTASVHRRRSGGDQAALDRATRGAFRQTLLVGAVYFAAIWVVALLWWLRRVAATTRFSGGAPADGDRLCARPEPVGSAARHAAVRPLHAGRDRRLRRLGLASLIDFRRSALAAFTYVPLAARWVCRRCCCSSAAARRAATPR